jgi:hypothetical protein
VLPPGEAGTDNAVQFAQFNATGEYPPHAVPEPADVPADRFGQAQPVLKRTRWTSHMSARRFVRSVDETTKGDVMNDTSPAEIFDEASNWIVGGGIVTMALFPLALPGIILTVAAAIPLAAVVLAVALVAGAVIAPVLLVRALGRRVIGLWRPERTASEPVRLSAAEGCG